MVHKHKKVLIALANGEKIQFKSHSVSNWTTAKSCTVNPIRDDELEWRVKPNLIKECYYTWSRTSGKDCNDKLEAYAAGFRRGAVANKDGEEL